MKWKDMLSEVEDRALREYLMKIKAYMEDHKGETVRPYELGQACPRPLGLSKLSEILQYFRDVDDFKVQKFGHWIEYSPWQPRMVPRPDGPTLRELLHPRSQSGVQENTFSSTTGDSGNDHDEEDGKDGIVAAPMQRAELESQEKAVKSFLFGSASADAIASPSPMLIRASLPVLLPSNERHLFSETALLGTNTDGENIFLNTSDPFVAITLGVQGSGKSHSSAVLLENCLCPCPYAVTLMRPMAGLVFHFDHSESNICEMTGLVDSHPRLPKENLVAAQAPLEKIIVLVSPSFYHQRKQFYDSGDGKYVVKPLLFRWNSLHAAHLKILMGIKHDDKQLYVSLVLAKLQEYQRKSEIPEFEDFCKEMLDLVSSGSQAGPLMQRFHLLRQIVYESSLNENLRGEMETDTRNWVSGVTRDKI